MLFVALKFALSYLNIYSGVAFTVTAEHYHLAANLQPSLFSPISGSVTANHINGEHCVGKYKIDLENELLTLEFEDATEPSLIAECRAQSVTISLNLTEQEYAELLNGEPKEVDYNLLDDAGNTKSAILQVLTEKETEASQP